MTQQHGDDDVDTLTHELHQLALRVEPPAPSVVADDLARGRRRLGRRRTYLVAGVAASVLVVAGPAVVLPGWFAQEGQEPGPGPEPAAQSGERVVEPRPGLGRAGIRRSPYGGYEGVLEEWNQVLAGHVDPDREHLRTWQESENRNLGMAGKDSDPWHMDTRFEWAEEGRDEVAMLRIDLVRVRDRLEWPCDEPVALTGAECSTLPAPAGTRRVEVARLPDGVLAVAAERDDGETVALTFDPWFVDLSTDPLETDPPPLEGMVAAVTDPRLALTGPEALQAEWGQPAIDRAVELFSAEGYRVQLAPVEGSEATGAMTRDGAKINLGWSIHPVRAGTVPLEGLCMQGVHEECVVRRVGGREVMLATHAGDPRRVDVVHRGEAAWTEVRLHGVRGSGPLPIDTAIALAIDERWQTSR